MLKLTAISAIAGVFLGSSAWAQVPAVTAEVTETALAEEFSLRPHVGFTNFEDPNQNGFTEMTIGATTDMNALKFYNPFNLDASRVFVGPESGLMFSHLSAAGASYFVLPLNLKVGFMPIDNLRLGIHGGGNLTYRSTANAMRFSPLPEGPAAALNLLPNIGLDIDYAITRNLALSARPDVTFTAGSNVFTASVALVIPLGTA